MVRVAGLIRQMQSGTPKMVPDGMTAGEQLDAIRTEVGILVGDAQRCLQRELLPELEREGIRFLHYAALSGAQRARAERSS